MKRLRLAYRIDVTFTEGTGISLTGPCQDQFVTEILGEDAMLTGQEVNPYLKMLKVDGIEEIYLEAIARAKAKVEAWGEPYLQRAKRYKFMRLSGLCSQSRDKDGKIVECAAMIFASTVLKDARLNPPVWEF